MAAVCHHGPRKVGPLANDLASACNEGTRPPFDPLGEFLLRHRALTRAPALILNPRDVTVTAQVATLQSLPSKGPQESISI